MGDSHVVCQMKTGWWFATMEFYDFPYIGNVIIPTDELIFFRGVETTNQMIMGFVVSLDGDTCNSNRDMMGI